MKANVVGSPTKNRTSVGPRSSSRPRGSTPGQRWPRSHPPLRRVSAKLVSRRNGKTEGWPGEWTDPKLLVVTEKKRAPLIEFRCSCNSWIWTGKLIHCGLVFRKSLQIHFFVSRGRVRGSLLSSVSLRTSNVCQRVQFMRRTNTRFCLRLLQNSPQFFLWNSSTPLLFEKYTCMRLKCRD